MAKKKTAPPEARDIDEWVAEVVASLRKASSKKVKDGMARYAIPSDKAFGVSVGDLKKMAKSLGRNHALAEGLWKTGHYEARMLACFVDDPAEVTIEQMDRWAKDFDTWAICDTATFALFDRTPHAWKKVKQWAAKKDEFIRRAAFAMMASLTVHDKKSGDEPFVEGLKLIEKNAGDERHWVKLAVNWALRSVGKRSNALHSAAVALAQKLAASDVTSTRWIGKDALRELNNDSVARRLAKK